MGYIQSFAGYTDSRIPTSWRDLICYRFSMNLRAELWQGLGLLAVSKIVGLKTTFTRWASRGTLGFPLVPDLAYRFSHQTLPATHSLNWTDNRYSNGAIRMFWGFHFQFLNRITWSPCLLWYCGSCCLDIRLRLNDSVVAAMTVAELSLVFSVRSGRYNPLGPFPIRI